MLLLASIRGDQSVLGLVVTAHLAKSESLMEVFMVGTSWDDFVGPQSICLSKSRGNTASIQSSQLDSDNAQRPHRGSYQYIRMA